MKHLAYPYLSTFALILLFVLNSCEENDDKKDWTETIVVFIGSEKVDYYPFENNGVPSDGINVREESSNLWTPLPLDFIEGFEFEEGFEYKLSVMKTHLMNYPMDGLRFTYKLQEIISKENKISIN